MALNSDTPYLQQLSPGRAKAPSDDGDVQEDVRKMQSLGLGLMYYPELEQLLNDELQRIKDTSGFAEVPGRAYILASPTMNALTTDEGNIYIPIGMLMDIQSMDEIDALLAHEFAHTVLSHTDVDILKEIQKKGTAAYALVNRLGMDAGGAESATRRIRNSFALYMATEKVLSPTWSRTQETDADKLAVDFLVQAGRNVNGMTALLGRLGQWEKANATLRENDKPTQSMLVAAASRQFAKNEWQALFIQALDPVGRQIEDGIAQAGHTHLSPEERLSNVNEYTRAHYRRAARPAMDSKTWRKVAHSQKSKRLAQSVVQSHVAFRSVSQGKSSAAGTALARSRHRDVNGQTFYQLAMASVAEDRGRSKEVLSLVHASTANVYTSYRLQVMAQQAKARQAGGKADGAELKALYEQFDVYGRPAEFYYDLIRLADTTDNVGLKVELAVRCQVAYFGDANACASGQKQAEAKQETGLVDGLLGVFGK
jgi:Zn-dependent protease with chaperone function